MVKSGSSVARWGTAAALVLALVAGAAGATEMQSQAVPSAPAYVVVTDVVPGVGGADVWGGDEGTGHVEFSVGFGNDLFLVVNGQVAAIFNPLETYTVTVVCYEVGGVWFADTTVVDSNNLTVCDQMGHPMPMAADNVVAAAEDVLSLDVD